MAFSSQEKPNSLMTPFYSVFTFTRIR